MATAVISLSLDGGGPAALTVEETATSTPVPRSLAVDSGGFLVEFVPASLAHRQGARCPRRTPPTQHRSHGGPASQTSAGPHGHRRLRRSCAQPSLQLSPWYPGGREPARSGGRERGAGENGSASVERKMNARQGPVDGCGPEALHPRLRAEACSLETGVGGDAEMFCRERESMERAGEPLFERGRSERTEEVAGAEGALEKSSSVEVSGCMLRDTTLLAVDHGGHGRGVMVQRRDHRAMVGGRRTAGIGERRSMMGGGVCIIRVNGVELVVGVCAVDGDRMIDQERREAREGPLRCVTSCCGRSGGKGMGVRCLLLRWKERWCLGTRTRRCSKLGRQ